MIKRICRGILGAAILLPVAASLPGCNQRNLFLDSKADNKLKYFDQDSAVETRETRQGNHEFGGFGFPTGPSEQ